MIWIISGGRDAGKSTRLHSLYCLQGAGDGLFMPKVISTKGEASGYDVVRLSCGKGVPLARRLSSLPADWDESVRQGRFSFSASGFSFAARAIEEMVERGISPVYLDEVGPLELAGDGFAPLLRRLLASRCDLVLTVRSNLLASLVSTFRLSGVLVLGAGRCKECIRV